MKLVNVPYFSIWYLEPNKKLKNRKVPNKRKNLKYYSYNFKKAAKIKTGV